jgi:hypothetical protein
MEKALLAEGLSLKQATLEQMEYHWQQVKKSK